MQEQEPNPTVDFLVRLKKIDKRSLTVRDILALYTVIRCPGIAGIDLARKIGIENRSNVACNINRLIREGYIEDRRLKADRATLTILHALPRGTELWDELKP